MTEMFRNGAGRLARWLAGHAGWLALLAILALALFLRLTFVTGLAFQDDFTYAQLAYDLSQGRTHFEQGGFTLRLGLYAPVAAFYAVGGVSDGMTIAWPLLCSLLGVLAQYGLGRLLAGEAAGLMAALLWSLFPLSIALGTALLPDGPLATFSALAVFFFLAAERGRGRWFWAAYGASVVCLGWAVLIKPVGLMNLVFLGAYLLLRRRLGRPAYLALVAVFGLGLGWYLLYTGVPAPGAFDKLWLGWSNWPGEMALTATDWFEKFLSAVEFRAFVPLILTAIAATLAGRPRWTTTPLLWLAVMFLYFELGTMTPFAYEPVPADWMSRQILFVLVPAILTAGVFLAQGLDPRSMSVIGLVVCGVTAVMVSRSGHGPVDFSELLERSTPAWLAQPYVLVSEFSAIVAVFGALASPLLLGGDGRRWKQLALGGLIGGIALTSLADTAVRVASYRSPTAAALDQTARYLAAAPDQLRIFVQDSAIGAKLNYATGFQLGFDVFAAADQLPVGRIDWLPATAEAVQEAWVVIADEAQPADQVVPEYWRKSPAAWWLEQTFGNVIGWQVRVYRVSVEASQRDLASAAAAAHATPSLDTITTWLKLALMSNDACGVVQAWQALQGLDFSSAGGLDPAPHYHNCLAARPEIAGPNLLQNPAWAAGLTGWQHDAAWAALPVFGKAPGSDQPILTVTATGTEDWRTIVQTVTLAPDTVYVYDADVRSTAPVVALYWETDAGRYYEQNTYPEWEHLQYVFLTPHWNGQARSANIYPFLLKGAGQVWLGPVRLSELQMK